MKIEITNPSNLQEKATINAFYEDRMVRKGKWSLSNGDPGYPDEYEEFFIGWEYVPENKEECPKWLTDKLVEEECQP